MIKVTAKIDGMACGMCEAHINDVVRKQFLVKKVTSSYKKGITEIIVEESLDEDLLRKVIGDTGYKVMDVQVAPYKKKGLFGW